MEVDEACDDPQQTGNKPDQCRHAEGFQHSTSEPATGNLLRFAFVPRNGHRQNLRNWLGKTLSPPRPEKIELVSDGTRKMPRQNTPITTSA